MKWNFFAVIASLTLSWFASGAPCDEWSGTWKGSCKTLPATSTSLITLQELKIKTNGCTEFDLYGRGFVTVGVPQKTEKPDGETLEISLLFNGEDKTRLVYLETAWQTKEGEVGFEMGRALLSLENSKMHVVTTSHAWASTTQGLFLGDNTSCVFEKAPVNF